MLVHVVTTDREGFIPSFFYLPNQMNNQEFQDRVSDLTNQLSWLEKQMARVLKDIEQLYEDNKVSNL
jgi:hypothetical protein